MRVLATAYASVSFTSPATDMPRPRDALQRRHAGILKESKDG